MTQSSAALRIVVTRPLPQGEHTAAMLRAKGYQPLVAPLMKTQTISADLAGTWSGVIFTSANAVHALTDVQSSDLSNLPAFVVGRRTGQAASEAGFADVISANGDGSDLADLIAARSQHARVGSPARLLYLAGEDRAFDLEAELRARDIAAKTVVVYRAVTQPYPPHLRDALQAGAVDAVLHFSRRSAENYVAGAKTAGLENAALSTLHLCLSPQVAEPLLAVGAKTRVAARPDEAALLDVIESL